MAIFGVDDDAAAVEASRSWIGVFTIAEEEEDYSTLGISEMLARGHNLLSPMSSHMFAPELNAGGSGDQGGVEAVEHPPRGLALAPALAADPGPGVEVAPVVAHKEEQALAGEDENTWLPEWEVVDTIAMDEILAPARIENGVVVVDNYIDSLPALSDVISPVCVGFRSEERWDIPQLPPHQPLLSFPVQVVHLPPPPAASGSTSGISEPRYLGPPNYSTKPKMTFSRQYSSSPLKKRLQWDPQLDAIFRNTVNQLGGIGHATPSAICEVMATGDITVSQVRSHLRTVRDRRGYRKRAPGSRRVKNAPSSKCQELDAPGFEKTGLGKHIEQELRIIDSSSCSDRQRVIQLQIKQVQNDELKQMV